MAIVNESRFELSIRGTVHQSTKYSYSSSMHLEEIKAVDSAFSRRVWKESKAPEASGWRRLAVSS